MVAASAALALGAVLLTGCTSAEATYDAAVRQGVAAIETAKLAVDQELAGRTFTPTAITTLGDARRELVDATGQVAETDASTAAEAETRAEVLDALGTALEAVGRARDAVASGVGSLGGVVPQLEDAAEELSALEQRPTPGSGGDG